MAMKYRPLGKSSLMVSEIGFGCMSLGGDGAANEKLVQRALELGINYFDTADIYDNGMNEARLGTILKSKRSQVILATKVGNQLVPGEKGLRWNPGREYILKSAEESLKRLQTDYIDLYQLHGGTMEDPMTETIEAFEKLKEQGKIRFYGISSIRPEVIRAYVRLSGIVSVMMQYSLLDRRPEESCLDLLKENQVGVLARGSIAQGLLVNKPARPYLNYAEADVRKMAEAVSKLSGPDRSPAQTALRYVLSHDAISSAVAGIRHPAQLEDLAAMQASPPLSEEEMQTLRQVLVANRYEQYR